MPTTLELVIGGLAFIAIGLPVCIMLGAGFVVLVPRLVWQLWRLTFFVVLELHDECREAWDRRRARKAGA